MSFASDWAELAQARDKLVEAFVEALGIITLLNWIGDRLIDLDYWLLSASKLSGAREEFLRKVNRRRVTVKAINVLEVLYCFWMGCQRPDCGARKGVRVAGALTAYAEDSRRANAPMLLCEEDREENEEYWGEMWSEYRSNLL